MFDDWHGFVDGCELGEPPMVEVSIRQGGGGLLPNSWAVGPRMCSLVCRKGEAQSVGVFAGQCTFKVIAVIGDHNCVTGQFVISSLPGAPEIKPYVALGSGLCRWLG